MLLFKNSRLLSLSLDLFLPRILNFQPLLCSGTLEWVKNDLQRHKPCTWLTYSPPQRTKKNRIAEWEAKKKKMGNNVFFKK